MCEYPLRRIFNVPDLYRPDNRVQEIFFFKRVQQDMFEIKSCVIERRFLYDPV